MGVRDLLFLVFLALLLSLLRITLCSCPLIALGGAQMPRNYYVYILASRSRNLYTGVTNSLLRRVAQHRQGLIPGFTADYRIFRLVYFETFSDIHAAINREKQIKAYRREKRIWLIRSRNPRWNDLAEGWLPKLPPMESEVAKSETSKDKSKAGPSPPSKVRPGSG
jgi:putative endonuclease